MKKIRRTEEIRIYRPKEKIIPEWETNTIVDNYTAEDGHVYNKSDFNIEYAKKDVDENRK